MLGEFLVLGLAAGAAIAANPDDRAGPNREQLIRWVRDLASPSYQERVEATRRLCGAGPEATQLLRETATGDDLEASLRARELLLTFERLLFSSVEISLSPSKNRIAWDEPIDLHITLHNTGLFPAHTPFAREAFRATGAAENHVGDADAGGALVRQVSDVLDIADWFYVAAPDGRRVELRIEDIMLDDAVHRAVEARARAGPITPLQPGERAVVTLRSLNRGFARYPFLDAGEYTVRVDYLPPWEDPALREAHVGRAVSAPVTLEVHTGAPDTVSRAGRLATLKVRRDDRRLVAELTNHSDLARVVNLNFGTASPYAFGRWVCTTGTSMRELPLPLPGEPGAVPIDARRFVTVTPGGRVELARIEMVQLSTMLDLPSGPAGDPVPAVHFYYLNDTTREWQRRQGGVYLGNPDAPAVLRTLLPINVLSVRATSNVMNLDGPD